MSIGAVLDLLRGDFPDVTISKIRFLEAEGLVTPERTASGYRRFTAYDCARLRFILTAQRDQYLPLKVIKAQVIKPGTAGFFDEHSVVIAQCAKALTEYGVEPRHLRAFRSAADRQSDLIAQIAGPVVKAGKAGARDRADDLAREVAALAITLHTSLIKSAVRDVLDR